MLASTAVLAIGSGPAVAQSASIHLPAQPLSQSLKDVAHQTGANILFAPEAVQGMKGRAVDGTMDALEAVERLIAGTNLEVVPDGNGGLVVRRKNVQAASSEEGAGDQTPSIETVVVTGTNIRGVSPAAPVISIDRKQIESSGYTSVGSYLQTLPENFAGGQNPGVVGVEGVNGGVNPISQSYSPNLRGIGSDSTLSLVDGHRMGFDGGGENVDISLIPLAAVDRVEIVTDGSSAIYGSDAVAGVVNVILRKSYEGAETQATFGGPTDGGGFQQQYSQVIGRNFDQGNVVAAYEYDKIDPLFTDQRSFSANALSPSTLLASQERNSAFASGSYQPSSRLLVQFTGLYSSKNNFSEENVFGTLSTFAGHVSQYSANGSATYAFGADGDVSLDANFAGNNQHLLETDFNPGGPPAFSPETIDSRSETAELKINVPSIELPTGALRAVVGAGYRQEQLKEISASAPGSFSRGIAYAFGEAYAPLVAPSVARLGLVSLYLDASVRYENYEKIGATTNPKLGIIYRPASELSLKATWGTSFRAPSLEQIHQPFTTGLFPGFIFGPPVPEDETVLFAFGPSPNLKPETSSSWTISADYSPDWLPGLKTTLTYYDILYKGRITNPIASPLSALSNPIFSPFVVLSPDAALQQSYIEKGAFANNTGEPYDPSNVYALVLDGIANVAREKISGIDALVSYRWSSDFGNWTAGANASWLDFVRIALPGAPTERINGTVFNPPTFKLRASVDWEYDAWSADAYLNYVSGETDNVATPSMHVGSWTTVDAQAGYKLSGDDWLTYDLAFRVSVQNLLNQAPPRLDQFSTLPFGIGFDAANASGLGRTVLATVSKQW